MKNVITSILILMGLVFGQAANAQCTTPTNLNATYSNNVSTYTWSAVPGAIEYRIEMKFEHDTWASIQYMTTVNTNNLDVYGIFHSAPTSWRVRAVCSADSSGWAEQNYAVPCPEASGLTTSNISMSSALISWVPALGYNTQLSDFVVSYRELGATSWISLGHTSDSSMTISGLTSGTTYEWCVNQSCLYSISNPMISQFTTNSCNSAGNNYSEWIRQFKLGSIDRKSGADNGGYYSSSKNTNLSIGSTKNKGKFRAGFAHGVQNQYYAIFIDLNGNGDYSDAGEMVLGPKLINTKKSRSFKLNIPGNVTPKTTGLRVIMQRSGGGPITGCMNNFNGETEDYIVHLTSSSNRPADQEIVQEVEKDELFSIYPNPSNGLYKVEIPSSIKATKYAVVGLDGKTITKAPLQDVTNFQFDLSSYPKSIYILNIVDESGQKHIFKLIKK